MCIADFFASNLRSYQMRRWRAQNQNEINQNEIKKINQKIKIEENFYFIFIDNLNIFTKILHGIIIILLQNKMFPNEFHILSFKTLFLYSLFRAIITYILDYLIMPKAFHNIFLSDSATDGAYNIVFVEWWNRPRLERRLFMAQGNGEVLPEERQVLNAQLRNRQLFRYNAPHLPVNEIDQNQQNHNNQ